MTLSKILRWQREKCDDKCVDFLSYYLRMRSKLIDFFCHKVAPLPKQVFELTFEYKQIDVKLFNIKDENGIVLVLYKMTASKCVWQLALLLLVVLMKALHLHWHWHFQSE